MKRYFLLIIPLVGTIYFFYYKYSLMSWTLPSEQENTPRQIVGEIVSIPVTHYQQAQFNFLVHYPDHLIKLSWHHAPVNLRVGDRWQLDAKLKRIHGLHNPGGFDYEAWALQHGLRATGSVVTNHKNTRSAHYWYVHPIDQIRQVIYENLKKHLPHSATAHWLLALAVGERADIPQEQWQVLRHTGTNHLMAIGGLHIGMATGFAYLLANWSWRRSVKLMLKRPAQEAATIFALVVAWCYGALSGFAIPAQRACLMLTIWVLATLSRRKLNAWYVWLLAMIIVLMINPLSILSESFWLSFGTIALIIYGMGGRNAIPEDQALYRFWCKHGRVQWVIGFGLLPLSLLFFQEWSLLSFIANAIAIPWLGLFILPFCLLGAFFIFIFPPLGNVLILVADKNLGWLWGVLAWLSHWHLATWSQAMPTIFIFALSLIGILLLMMPAKFPARWLGVIWLAPLILYKPPLLAAGRAQATMLDVGQGLSVVVQTRHHVLVFDAGPPLQDVVVPFLRKQFVKQLDMLVISHGDNDHSGGANDILQTLPVRDVVTSVPEKFPASLAKLCLAGQHWQWDEVDFRFIYPFQDTLHLGNDSSCVLRISTKYNSMIIPGDIEQFAEAKLLERSWHHLAATVLVAPHHGSSTSSTLEFVNAVYPRYVFYATGYLNRYRFPHKEVVTRYEQLGAESFDTARVGAVTIRL